MAFSLKLGEEKKKKKLSQKKLYIFNENTIICYRDFHIIFYSNLLLNLYTKYFGIKL